MEECLDQVSEAERCLQGEVLELQSFATSLGVLTWLLRFPSPSYIHVLWPCCCIGGQFHRIAFSKAASFSFNLWASQANPLVSQVISEQCGFVVVGLQMVLHKPGARRILDNKGHSYEDPAFRELLFLPSLS